MDTKPVVPFETIALLRQLAQKLHKQGETCDALILASAIEDVVHATNTPTFYADTFWGSCPCCGDCEEVLVIDRKSYAVCHEHRMYWYIGTDYLSYPNYSDQPLGQSRNVLAAYREVPAEQAFAQNACPCCGLSIEHASWCINQGAKRP
jgi:hypothetical protein